MRGLDLALASPHGVREWRLAAAGAAAGVSLLAVAATFLQTSSEWWRLLGRLRARRRPRRTQRAAGDCALVVVDIQKDFYSRNPAVLASFPELGSHVSDLLRLCRRAGVEVVHIREGSNPCDSAWYDFWQRLNPGRSSEADAAQPEEFAKECRGERVFVKYGYDGVGVNSGLEPYLRKRGFQQVLVCGLVTSCCVHMNAAGLFLRGYETYVIEDACGDRTPEMHRASLRRESRRSYAVVAISAVRDFLAGIGSGEGGDLLSAAWPNATQFEK